MDGHLWLFFIAWVFIALTSVWALIAPDHYYKTWRPFLFNLRNTEPTNRRIYIRLLAIAMLGIMVAQMIIVPSLK